MPDVHNWPPVKTRSELLTENRPVMLSRGLSGSPRFTQTKPTRRTWAVQVTGQSGDAHGQLEVLKQFLRAKVPLVRISPCGRHSRKAVASPNTVTPVVWKTTSGGAGVTWKTSSTGSTVSWYLRASVTGAGVSGSAFYVDLDGLTPGETIAIPGQLISVGSTQSHVINRAVAADDGTVRIYTLKQLPSFGALDLNAIEAVVMEILEPWPEPMQTVDNSYFFDFKMVEAFESDYADGVFTDVTIPW